MIKGSKTFSAANIISHPWLSFFGSFPYYLLPVKRAVIKHNIKLVYEDLLSPREITKFTKIIYGNLMQVALEVLCNSLRSKAKRAQQLEIQNLEIIEQAFSAGKGLLWMGCHLGNWEAGLVNLMHKIPELQGRTTVIRKQLRPPWLNRLVTEQFRASGIDVLPPDPSSIKKILRKLKNNEVVAFVLDQHSSIEGASVARFFGHDVQITKSLAKLALLTETPVVPIFTWRKSRGQHVCHFANAIPAQHGRDRNESITQTTQAYSDALEEVIGQHPEQWFCWLHRLWKASSSYKKGSRFGGFLVRLFRRLRLI